MVYWAVNTGTATSKIQRKSLNGGAVEDIFGLQSSMTGIAIDPVARHVYVGTPGVATRIARYSIDSPTSASVFVTFNESGCSPICTPQGLALDLAGGFLYWADANGSISRKALASGTVQSLPSQSAPASSSSAESSAPPRAPSAGTSFTAYDPAGRERAARVREVRGESAADPLALHMGHGTVSDPSGVRECSSMREEGNE